MAKHTVKFSIPERELGKADVEFKVRRDDKSFGRLLVSNGSIEWIPGDHEKAYRVAWPAFHDWIKANGTKIA